MTEEWVDWVDEHDRLIASVPRSRMRREQLCHRASYIVVQDPNGLIYVQRRTQTKDYCPGMLDACCGGVVQSGEAYLPSAYRELAEEMGIEGVTLQEHGRHLLGGGGTAVWGGLYSCHYAGPLRLQAEEVEYVQTMTVAEILANQNEFAPDSLQALQIWLAQTRGDVA